MTASATPPETQVASDLAAARHVLEAEAAALSRMSADLDADFSRALDLIEARVVASEHGRVIVSGMGKSGHIGRKISATLASTGTPSFFVHPGEASHGDLGMITRQDALILLSKSGETAELADMIAYSRRFAIPLIAITERRDSALGKAADVVLALPHNGEACPLGLAPTTSTTASLAIGDAVAVALLERRGFSATDFKVFHPGGKLGQRLLKVRELMHAAPEVPLIALAAPMSEALIVMSAKSFGCVGIVDAAGLLAGIITDGDLRRHMAPDLLERPAAEVMTRSPLTVGPDSLAAEALGLMNDRKVTSLFVVADGRPVGLVHMHDCLRAGVS
ncbi:D-arabinose 5-phosphate isomerase [uncultured Alphaproteobacteria bacterium]|uniref:D-arabinose 5-phosphate isomerase n=1 Tax=uncultured Alphaproteobacteria bacterium TaxID=91750 RepID=A0A212KHP1_9PROT|nr:D-arabinose 5-phosphate isomerase [uncultured Alphaproteobacteria bacterium]